MIEIRQAAACDVPSLLPMVEAYWTFEGIAGFESGRVAAQLERLLSTPRLGAGWIALADGEAAGYLLGVVVFSLEHLGVTAEIDEFFVWPHWRGQGLGAALLGAAETGFRRAGCTNVSLQISRHNRLARAFYQRHGYGERAGFELLEKRFLKSDSLIALVGAGTCPRSLLP